MFRSFYSSAGAAMSLLALSAYAVAPSQSMTQMKVSSFNIDYVTEKGRFDRCAATLSPGPNMLRIAYNKDLKYSISVPGVNPPANTITFLFGKRPWVMTPSTDPGRGRAWSAVGSDVIEAFMNVKGTIAIDLGNKKYRWPVGNTNLMDVMGKLEDCTHHALGHY